MNKFGPIIPPGYFMEPQYKSRARFRVAVFVVLAAHAFGLLALLMQGCNQPPPTEAATVTNETNAPPPFVQPTNPLVALEPSSPPSVPANPPPEPPPAVRPAATPLASAAGPESVSVAGSEYKICKGDTFKGIARRFHVSVRSLMNANPGVRATRLRIGQTICIPTSSASAASAASTRVAVAAR